MNIRRPLIFGFGASVALLAWWASSQPMTDTLSWTAPTTREDGAALSPNEIAQYNIRFGKVDGAWAETAVAAGNVLTWQRNPRPAGRACYALQTQDSEGLVSVWTESVCTEKCPMGQRITEAGDCEPKPRPSPPGNVRAQ